jgi:hypothetical protein
MSLEQRAAEARLAGQRVRRDDRARQLESLEALLEEKKEFRSRVLPPRALRDPATEVPDDPANRVLRQLLGLSLRPSPHEIASNRSRLAAETAVAAGLGSVLPPDIVQLARTFVYDGGELRCRIRLPDVRGASGEGYAPVRVVRTDYPGGPVVITVHRYDQSVVSRDRQDEMQPLIIAGLMGVYYTSDCFHSASPGGWPISTLDVYRRPRWPDGTEAFARLRAVRTKTCFTLLPHQDDPGGEQFLEWWGAIVDKWEGAGQAARWMQANRLAGSDTAREWEEGDGAIDALNAARRHRAGPLYQTIDSIPPPDTV